MSITNISNSRWAFRLNHIYYLSFFLPSCWSIMFSISAIDHWSAMNQMRQNQNVHNYLSNISDFYKKSIWNVQNCAKQVQQNRIVQKRCNKTELCKKGATKPNCAKKVQQNRNVQKRCDKTEMCTITWPTLTARFPSTWRSENKINSGLIWIIIIIIIVVYNIIIIIV